MASPKKCLKNGSSSKGNGDDAETLKPEGAALLDETIMRLIVFPQAIRNILPAIGNEFVAVIKE